MDPFALIVARQEYERLADVSRAHHRFGSAYILERSGHPPLGLRMVTRLHRALNIWWSPRWVGRLVGASPRSATVAESAAGDSSSLTVIAEINRRAVGS
jgi:hypothetical protein